MKKAIAVSSLVLLSFVSLAVAAQPQGQPFQGIYDAISSLQNQIDHIHLIPGPKGDKGDKGDPGTPSWDESRISALEARVSALENPPVLPPKTITLWNNYTPVDDETDGVFIDVTGYANASLNFDWQPGILTHTCQYAYKYSSNGLTVGFDSTFLYFPGSICAGTVNVPIGTKYLEIDSWTPPSGILNASLTLSN